MLIKPNNNLKLGQKTKIQKIANNVYRLDIFWFYRYVQWVNQFSYKFFEETNVLVVEFNPDNYPEISTIKLVPENKEDEEFLQSRIISVATNIDKEHETVFLYSDF